MRIALIIAVVVVANWFIRWIGPKVLPPWFRLRYFRPWVWLRHKPYLVSDFIFERHPWIFGAPFFGMFVAALIIAIDRLVVEPLTAWLWGWTLPLFPTNAIIYAIVVVVLALVMARGFRRQRIREHESEMQRLAIEAPAPRRGEPN